MQTIQTSLYDLQAKISIFPETVAEHPAVLVFYRGGWCPYCNRQLAALGEVEQELRGSGYRIHTVSPDSREKIAETAAGSDFTYTLYSDAPAEAAKAFGLAYRVDAAACEKLLGYRIDPEEASEQGPMPRGIPRFADDPGSFDRPTRSSSGKPRCYVAFRASRMIPVKDCVRSDSSDTFFD